MRCGTPTITWSQWISMPIAQRREASKGCGCRHSIGGARACSTSHEWRGSPPTGPSASTPTTYGKYPLNFPPNESKNKRLDQRQSKLPVGHVMLRAIDEYAGGVFSPDDVRILVAAFDDAWRSLLASGITFESDRDSNAVRDTLAKHIIEQARYGERDQRRLRDGALLQYTQSKLKSKPRK